MNELRLKNGKLIPFKRLQNGDLQALQKFNRKLTASSRKMFLPHAYDDKTIAIAISRSERDEDRVYIAIDNNQVVAYFFLWYFKSKFPILGIGIADDYQGAGMGKQIMAKLIVDGKQAKCDGIELTTVITNKAAFALYEKVGFKCLGTVENIDGTGRIVKEWHMLYPFRENITPPTRKHESPF